MRTPLLIRKFLFSLVALIFLPIATVFAAEPVMRTVMFWQAGCPECEKVLVGSEKVPAELPGLVDRYLAVGGVESVVHEASVAETRQAVAQPRWSGMGLAWAIFIGMLLALILAIWLVVRAFKGQAIGDLPGWVERVTPVLAVIGLGVAVYMTYIETVRALAICGPIGDCNAVQNSPYARLFGVLPVGLLGVIGYIAILLVWLWSRYRQDTLAEMAPAGILGMTLFGTLFSVYLTYLEIFVIRAVCIWCLSSAVIMTLLMLAGLPKATTWIAATEE